MLTFARERSDHRRQDRFAMRIADAAGGEPALTLCAGSGRFRNCITNTPVCEEPQNLFAVVKPCAGSI